MNVEAVAVAVVALFHDAFVDGVIGHAANAVRQQVAVVVTFHLVAGDAFEVGAVGAHVHVEVTRRVGQ